MEGANQHPMILSFDRMALRDAVRSPAAGRDDVADRQPRDMIDGQSFMWVQGSDEYA